MSATESDRLTVRDRRRAMKLAYTNGALWAIGNGLITSTLVIYLAFELGLPEIGLGIGLIKAAPYLVGVLRLSAPALIGRLAGRKRFCISMFLASSLMLLGIPVVAAPGILPSPAVSMTVLIVLWSLFHLFQYLAMVALWSWLANLAPGRIRGRFLGRRERWIAASSILAMLASGGFIFLWKTVLYPQSEDPALDLSDHWWIGYAIAACLGAIMMILALVPLARMPAISSTSKMTTKFSWSSLAAPFADQRFRRLLYFGCWFSFFNGITQSAQYHYVLSAWLLDFSLFTFLAMQAFTKAGQVALSPAIGRFCDRFGNRPVLILSQLLVATGPLFYFLATPEQRWWNLGAWFVWIAYVGINICLPNLMLKLSPENSNVPYIAVFYTVTGLFFAANTILGGLLLDRLKGESIEVYGWIELDYYQYIFLIGWIGRTLGVVFLLRIIEPGAWRWWKILSRKSGRTTKAAREA